MFGNQMDYNPMFSSMIDEQIRTKQQISKDFDYSYLYFNSLYSNSIVDCQNRLDFSIVSKGESQTSMVGVSVYPTQIVQLKISTVQLSRKFQEQELTVNELLFGKLFICIPQFMNQAYSSPYGFKYHFVLNIVENPNDLTQLLGIPVDENYIFSNPVLFNGKISFDFYTNKKYNIEEDTYECYIDYTQQFLTLFRVGGLPHRLSNLDVVFIDNFEIPNLISKDDVTTSTHKSKYYRVSVIDQFRFEIQIQLQPQITTNINRPADPVLGIYVQPVQAQVITGNPTTINASIYHGLQNGNYITIQSTSRNDLDVLRGTYQVNIISPTSFTIPIDTLSIHSQGLVYIDSFPINKQRLNTIFIKVITKKIDFSLTIRSISESAKNNLQNINI